MTAQIPDELPPIMRTRQRFAVYAAGASFLIPAYGSATYLPGEAASVAIVVLTLVAGSVVAWHEHRLAHPAAPRSAEQTAVLEHVGWGEESPLAVLGAPVWTPPETLAEPAWPDLRDVIVVKAQHRARIGGAFGASLPASDVTDLPTVDLTAQVEEYLATVKKAAQDALAETASTYVKARQAVRA